jgi:hypothetical protein
VVGVLTLAPRPCRIPKQPATDPMRFPLSMASRLSDRQTVWVSAADNAKNGSRPSQFVHWGVPTATIAAQYSEAHRGTHRCPISGWVSQQG